MVVTMNVSGGKILNIISLLIVGNNGEEYWDKTRQVDPKIEWYNNDWTHHQTNFMEEEEKFTSTIQFNPTQIVNLAVYSPEKLKVLTQKNRSIKGHKIPIDKKYDWFHFGFFSDNQTLYVFREHQVIQKITNVEDIEEFSIKTSIETRWKIDYCTNCKVSTTPSRERPTYLIIPPADRSELILKYSFCLNCSLELIITRDNRTKKITIKNMFEKNSSPKIDTWQNHTIEISPQGPTYIEIQRKTFEEKNAFSYWIIDIGIENSNRIEENSNIDHFLLFGLIIVLISAVVLLIGAAAVLKTRQITKQIELSENTLRLLKHESK